VEKMSLLYEQESYIIRGVAFDIYKVFRNRHKEKIYQNALYLGLKHKGLNVAREKQVKIYYSGERVGTYTPDFVVNRRIIVELKAKPRIIKEDLKKFWEYLKGSNCKLGFLINFGASDGVEIYRRIYETARLRSSSAWVPR
jgi:GxxExxY protein